MSMLKNPATKYRPVAPVRLTDRTWPDVVLTKAPAAGKTVTVTLGINSQITVSSLDPRYNAATRSFT